MSKPRTVDIKKNAAKTGFVCRNLKVDQEAGEGPTFVFDNKTEYHADVDFLGQSLVLDPASGNPVPKLTVDPRKPSRTLQVNVDLGHGYYMFQVVLREIDLEAEGGSRPGIEIVP